ncbi:hypothetical protein A3D72_00650 [Candidatus Uhrbacteria bacterium RIFCSPHIGHO2_02_FULL_57_19]|uniref:Uncharacterized protein n=1 Tax=Candidatus Uhrbacteria bacterium RIFCSPHIGHO2_02_FULL_57_19 TaxID=1802391 RepID=A0A1F7U4I7_9BACT|nr:MAG: hypothetical protein A3D72_00650 [Candidatus Uhrbacteria bacterium RIFCSPHIGHO2_02_FULL_57_19]
MMQLHPRFVDLLHAHPLTLIRKEKVMRWLLFGVCALLGCRENQDEPWSEIREVNEVPETPGVVERLPDPEEAPECDSGFATKVVIAAAPEGRRLPLAKQDQTMDESARLRAVAWHEDEGGDPLESFVSFEWEIADEGVAFLLPYGAYGQGAMVWGRQDRFDVAGGEDPETTVTVCAVNDCRDACSGCESRVCSEQLRIVGVPNLEGRWTVTADTAPFPFNVDVFQDGEQLLTLAAGIDAMVSGETVRFTLGEEVYTGTIAESRDRVEGLITRKEDERAHLTWSAVRVPDI